MRVVYIDTNVFVYASEPESGFHKEASEFLINAKNLNLSLVTSVETFQEIVHLSRIAGGRVKSVKLCRDILKLTSNPLEINFKVLLIFLKLVEKYQKLESRDCLHLAVCIENNVEVLVTQDEHFAKVKEIKVYRIKEALRKYGQGVVSN